MVLRICEWLVLALSALLVPLQSFSPNVAESEPLDGIAEIAWLPADGEVWVLSQEGESARVFDVFLTARSESRDFGDLPDGAVRRVAGTGPLELPVWGRRTLHVDPQHGSLVLGRASWERAPVLRCGPGWVCIELRSAHAAGSLEWRRVGESERHALQFRGDRADALTQRVWIEGVDAGDRIEMRWRPPQPRFPAPPPPEWVVFEMPTVEAGGARPTSAWPGA